MWPKFVISSRENGDGFQQSTPKLDATLGVYEGCILFATSQE